MSICMFFVTKQLSVASMAQVSCQVSMSGSANANVTLCVTMSTQCVQYFSWYTVSNAMSYGLSHCFMVNKQQITHDKCFITTIKTVTSFELEPYRICFFSNQAGARFSQILMANPAGAGGRVGFFTVATTWRKTNWSFYKLQNFL